MLTRTDCVDSILHAVNAANERYVHWSNGYWLSDAGVEAMICYEIADAFANHPKRGGWSIGLEVAYSGLETDSGASRKQGKPPSLVRGGARADVVLYDGQAMPKYVIEVKRSWSEQGVLSDGARLGTILKRGGSDAGGSIRAGFLAIFDMRRPGSKQTDQRVKALRHELFKQPKLNGLRTRYREGEWKSQVIEGKEWRYRGVCCLISRPSKSG